MNQAPINFASVMSLIIKEAKSNGDLKAFVSLPFSIYKGNKFWIPPLKKDELHALIPTTNPAFRFCKAKFWICVKNGKVVGRIAGIINHNYNEKMGQQMARFSRVEFIDDEKVTKLLFETAENWAKEEGMEGIHGPLGFTNLDHQGLLVEGFDHIPSVASEYHQPYYLKHLETNGYKKEIDWVEFRLTIKEIPEKALRLNEVIKERYGLRVLTFQNRKEMLPYTDKVFQLLNDAFADLFSVVKLDAEMRKYYIDRYFGFLNPKFVKFVLDKEENMVGFIIGLPSLSKAMQKTNGSLWPFGWYHLASAMKSPDVIDLMLTAVHPKMQAQGVPAILITELQKTLLEHHVKYAETTGIFETNEKAIQVWKNYEHIQHKRKRCFIKMF